MSVLHDPGLERLLDRLHAKSDEQVEAIRIFQSAREHGTRPQDDAARIKEFRSDKLITIDSLRRRRQDSYSLE